MQFLEQVVAQLGMNPGVARCKQCMQDSILLWESAQVEARLRARIVELQDFRRNGLRTFEQVGGQAALQSRQLICITLRAGALPQLSSLEQT